MNLHFIPDSPAKLYDLVSADIVPTKAIKEFESVARGKGPGCVASRETIEAL
jgi:hypothetical protein